MTLVEKKTIQIGENLLLDVLPDEEFMQVRFLHKGDEFTSKVKKSDLYGAVFAIADPQTQDALMPVRTTEVLTFEKIHNVQLKKDMRKGAILKVRCHIDVPVAIEENLKGIVREHKKQATTIALR